MENSDKYEPIATGSWYGLVIELLCYRSLKMHDFRV